MKGMGGLRTLLTDPAYFHRYQVIVRYNAAMGLRPTEQEFVEAKASMTAEEKRRNVPGFFYTSGL